MFKKDNQKELISDYKYMQKIPCWNIDKDNYLTLLNASTPEKANFLRVSSVVALPSIFYNFKLQTKEQCAYFCICAALGNTDDFWAFLELATIGKNKVLYYESEQEGPVSILRIEHIDLDTLRFTLISNRWLEHKWISEKRTAQVTWAEFPEGGFGVNLDILIDKKDFIYAFYLELWDIFSGENSIPVEPEAASNRIAKADSEIIRGYLGYIPVAKLDKELQKAINDNKKNEIKSLLSKGANPNAIINEDNETIFEDFLQTYCDNVYDNEFDKRCLNKNISGEESSAIEEAMLDFRENMENDFYKIAQIMIQHGAKTLSLFPAIYNYNRKTEELLHLLLDNKCVFDMGTLGFVVTDTQHESADEKLDKNSYERIESLFSKYLFSCSYKCASESDLIFHKPPEYYYWQGKRYLTQKDWDMGIGKETL